MKMMKNGNEKKKIKTIARYLLQWGLPLLLTVALVWYMFQKVDFSEMMRILRHGVDYGWILLAMGISVFSHVFRAIRWRLQLRSLGIRPPLLALCCSIFGCYALNLVFPRLGEVWRCTYISRREKSSFTKVFGSMMADRLSDSVFVFFLTVLTFIVATPAIEAFLDKYPLGRGLVGIVSSVWFWAALAGLIFAVWAILRFGRDNGAVKRAVQWIRQLWEGFADVWRMKGRWSFILLTFAIWGCYFIQLYVAFFAFSFTADLCTRADLGYGLVPCLVAFVFSSIGMAIPSNGGLGPWNIAVIFGLAIYGVSDAQGTAFSMLQWSGSTVMIILLGIFTMAYIAMDKPKSLEGKRKDLIAESAEKEMDE